MDDDSQPKNRIKKRSHWLQALYDNPVGKVASAAVLATAAAAAIWTAVPRERPQINIPSISRPADSSQSTGQTVVDTYYSQARSAILQDVPGLADPQYKSALDYTAQHVVDMKNVYGLTLDQVRAPMAKWVQANVDWDRKGERLIKLEDRPDYIPLDLFEENGTFDSATRQQNWDIGTPARINDKPIPRGQFFTANVDSIIDGHDQIWADIHDPEKLKSYLRAADYDEPLRFTAAEAKKYKNAISGYGSFEDKAHWAMIGRAALARSWTANEELNRNEDPHAMILSVGGDARIETNHQSWDISAYKGPSKMRPNRNDRQLAFRVSNQLKSAIAADPKIYGRPIDPDYLAPNLPSFEAIEKARGYVAPETGVVLLDIPAVTIELGRGLQRYLVGGPRS